MGTLFCEVYTNKTKEELINIYNELVEQSNGYYNFIYKLKKIDDIKTNNIYLDTSFENQTLFLIKKTKKSDIYYNSPVIKHKDFSSFIYKEANILASIIITSLNKDNLIDAKIIISNNDTIYNNYSEYFGYELSPINKIFNTSIYTNNNSIYNELIFSEVNEKLNQDKKYDIFKKYNNQLSEIFKINIEDSYNYGYFIDNNFKLLIEENNFNKILIGIVINDASDKKYLIIVRAFDNTNSLTKMLDIIMSDTLKYLKSLKKGRFNAGETLLKLKACINKILNIKKT